MRLMLIAGGILGFWLFGSICAHPGQMAGISHRSAAVGTTVTISGTGFGATPGVVVLTGLRVAPTDWSDTEITFVVPDDGVSGPLYFRTADGTQTEAGRFTVERLLPAGQIAPYGMVLEETGLPGPAFLVETDGASLYGVSGFETLSTYQLRAAGPHAFRSRLYLNQRVADLRVQDGYLFCVGDHGLLIWRCADLQTGAPPVAAAVAGGSYYGVDARPDPAGEVDGLLVALSEHAPRWGANTLRVVFYEFAGGELTRRGTFARVAGADERQFAVALDPLNRKAYVSGWLALSGANKYLLELATTNLAAPTLQHREETGVILAGDMDAVDNVLWTAVTTTVLGNELFRAYTLKPGLEPLALTRTISGGPAFGRVARVRILDCQTTAGCSWFGNRPDLFLLSTFGDTSVPAVTRNSLDWAFDVTGFAQPAGTNAGKIIVADEWGGFITLDYQVTPKLNLSRQSDYQWVPASAMTEGLHLAEGRIYVANRGAGPWSADARNLADDSQWRRAEFDWTAVQPPPHPISAICTRRDPQAGMLIAALGHEKAMAWGTEIIGLLYRETATNIALLAQADAFDPPGAGSVGVSVVWPEPDLVWMTTGSDGFRAYVVDPLAPSLTLHRDCRVRGFATNVYSTAMTARCFKHHLDADNRRRLIVGSVPGLLVGAPTLNLFALNYPAGVPDRAHPNRPIEVIHESALQCLAWKHVRNLDVRPSGWVAVATSAGVGVFHLSWVPALNQMNDFTAWDKIRVPAGAYAPWWHSSWSSDVADVSFADDNTIYVVKATEGVWRLILAVDPLNHTHRSMATAYYPGVNCGMNYSLALHGWANPDLPTLPHPYGVVAEGGTAWVTGWSGKVQRLGLDAAAGVRILHLTRGADRDRLTFAAPYGNRRYWVETTAGWEDAPWATVPNTVVQRIGNGLYAAECPRTGVSVQQFYRIGVRP